MADKLGRRAGWRSAGLLLILCILAFASQADGQARSDRAAATFSGAKYVVQPGDVLRVRIWGWPTPQDNVEGSFPVEASGVSYLPVIGRLEVVGKTAEDVQEEFRRRFAEEQRNPVVTVSAMFAVSVMGEVKVPGVVDVSPGYTVFEALSLSGGFAEDANRTQILLVRGGKSVEVGGRTASEAATSLAAMRLESGDRVIVQRSRSPVYRTANTIFQALLYAATLVVLLSK